MSSVGVASANVCISSKDPRSAALVGMFVADAATMPLHWIYDQTQLKETIGTAEPLFFNTPSCPFYSEKQFPGHYTVGQLSPYGEQALAWADFLTRPKADYDGQELMDQFHGFIATYTGRFDGNMKKFEASFEAGCKFPECGADDVEAHAFAKVVAANFRFGASDEAAHLANLETAVRSHQNNDFIVETSFFWARMLRAVCAKSTMREAYEEAKSAVVDEKLKTALDLVDENMSKDPLQTMVHWAELNALNPMYAFSCSNPQATILALLIVLNNDDFTQALTANLLAGGDNAGRAAIIGALLAARAGTVPEELVAKLGAETTDKIAALVTTI